MLRRLVALTLLIVLLAPVAASAQQNPFQLPPAQPDTPTTTAAPSSSTTTDNGGLSRGQEILLFVGGVALICGIGYGIVHDARKRAPVKDERAFYRDHSIEGTPPKRKADRKKTKAQKAARKRQRARR